MDGSSSSQGDQGDLRRPLPRDSREKTPQVLEFDKTEADPASEPEGRVGHRGLESQEVARAQKKANKKANEEGRTVVFVDETGFYLLPSVVRTYAPRGVTPVLSVPLTRDHISAIGAITLDGRVLLSTQDRSYRGPDGVRFLKQLLSHIVGKLLVIWDGSPIHKGDVVKEYLANGAASHIHLEALPGYAPELNPKEGIWNYLKRVELGNMCCTNLVELRRELRLAAARIRHRPQVIQGCIEQVHCYV